MACYYYACFCIFCFLLCCLLLFLLLWRELALWSRNFILRGSFLRPAACRVDEIIRAWACCVMHTNWKCAEFAARDARERERRVGVSSLRIRLVPISNWAESIAFVSVREQKSGGSVSHRSNENIRIAFVYFLFFSMCVCVCEWGVSVLLCCSSAWCALLALPAALRGEREGTNCLQLRHRLNKRTAHAKFSFSVSSSANGFLLHVRCAKSERTKKHN